MPNPSVNHRDLLFVVAGMAAALEERRRLAVPIPSIRSESGEGYEYTS
jgi:hypothetical protein